MGTAYGPISKSVAAAAYFKTISSNKTQKYKAMNTSEKITMLKNAGFSVESIQLALTAASLSDPDCAYTSLQDAGEFEAAEVIEYLYFDTMNDEFTEDEYFEPDFDTDTLIADQFDTDLTFNG